MASSSPPPIPQELLEFDLLFDPFSLEFPEDPSPDEGQSRLLPPSGTADASDPSWVDEIERFLMGDDGEEPPASGDFLSLSNVVPIGGSEEDGSSKSGVSDGDASTPKTNGDLAERTGGEGEGEDAAAKKRRRQLRNRDSAMKSRERRKLYVQDLEKKNKFLEAECRRLQHILQCCTAENIALQHRLQNGRLHGVPGAKQESAVLFEESLLLGSLFWLVNIVFLFLAPTLMCGLDLGHAAVTERPRGRSQGAKGVGKTSILEFTEVALCRRGFIAFKRKMKFSTPVSLVLLPTRHPCIACS